MENNVHDTISSPAPTDSRYPIEKSTATEIDNTFEEITDPEATIPYLSLVFGAES
jgi:hypothetical protein